MSVHAVRTGFPAMLSARFRIQLPEGTWVRDVSETYPNATFRLLSGIRTGETASELGEVRTDQPVAVAESTQNHPAILRYERLEVTDDRLLGKYETTDTGLYEFVAASDLPPEFPVVVRNGWYEFDLTGTREEFDRFRGALDGLDRPYRLLSVVGEDDEEESMLTDRQRELMAAAVREGYFEVPRECTLAELADRVDADKSTVSGVLRRGESRLVKWFLAGAGREG